MSSTSEEIITIKENETVINNSLSKLKTSLHNKPVLLLELVESDNSFKQDQLYQKLTELSVSYDQTSHLLLEQNLDEFQIWLLNRQSNIHEYNLPFEAEVYKLKSQKKDELAKDLMIKSNLGYRYTNTRNLNELAIDVLQKTHETIVEAKRKQDKLIKTILISAITSLLVFIILTFIIVRTQNQHNSKLTKLANTDRLTSLPNRNSLINSLEKSLSNSPDSIFVIAFLDIDHFKSINDGYGHEIGDEILKLFSDIISKSILPDDVLSRFGGDEFVLLLKNLKTRQQAVNIISNISRRLDTSFKLNGNEVFVSSSIGVSIYNKNNRTKDCQTLLNQADNAMYSAKKAGRNCFHFFSKETYDLMKRENAIAHALHTIIKNKNKDKQLFLKYQPFLNLSNQKMSGCEALLRWTTNKGMQVSTEEFIGIAEKTNLIDDINLLVIQAACEQQKKWQLQGYTDMRININLSGNKNNFRNLLTQFTQQLERYRLSPNLFGIELTERTILEVSPEAILKLNDLRSQGLKISIDDFGTGYSSLSYLKKLPITTIKIDKSFVAGLPHDNDDKELVKTIISLGHNLKLDIVAEGIENDSQLKFLLDNNCDVAQGYYYHRPLGLEQFEELKKVA